MDLYEIRNRTAYDANTKPTQKNAARSWAHGLCKEYQFAVTLTLKQSMSVKTDYGVYIHQLKRTDCDAIARRFTQKLNREAFGKAADRYAKSLSYLPIVEGERSGKNLHLHLAIGQYPKTYQFNQFPTMVQNAVNLVRELDEQHNVQIMDSGWIDYITKELGRKDTDNVLWQLA